MTTILAPASRSEAAAPGGFVPRWTFTLGALAGSLTAAVGLAVLSAVTVLLWATGPQADGRSADPFRTAAAFWVLGHRGAVDFPGTRVQLAPLGLAVLFALVAVRAAGWASRAAQAHDLPTASRVVAGFTVGLSAGAVLAARLTEDHTPHVGLWSALIAVVPFGLVCAAAGVAPQTYEWAQFLAPRRARWTPIVRSALASGLVLFAGGAIVVAAGLFVRHGLTADLFVTTGGGFSGGLGLLLLSVVLLPTAACWVVAFAAGPGFAMGTDASVTLAGVHTGAVPSLPLTGALPGPGGVPWYGWLPPVLVLLAGVVAGLVEFAPESRLRSKLARAGAAAGLTGLLATAMLIFSAGDAGGRLSTLGPGLSVGPILAGELAVVAVVTAAIRHAIGPRPAVAAPSVPTQRIATEPVPAAPAVDPLADDPLRFAGIPSDAEDLEDTQELPVIRFEEPVIENVEDIEASDEPVEDVGEVEETDDGGRLRQRWARAKTLLRKVEAEDAAAEEISPEAAEAMSVAQAQYSSDLTLTDG